MVNKEFIKNLKKGRIKPEERWFIDILYDLKGYISDKYPDSIFYKKNNEILFKYDSKTGYFYCDYDDIWLIFQSKYHINYKQISELIKDKVEEHLKLKNVTPMYYDWDKDNF